MKHVLTLLLLCASARAATYCVGPSATGSGSGADWNNQKAWTDIPARGDTWYLAGGTYSPKVFNTPDNGQYITIVKASATNNFTNVGWLPIYGTLQASWTSVGGQTLIEFDTGHWIFDGSYRNEANWFDGTSYGFTMTNLSLFQSVYYAGNGFSNCTARCIHHQGGIVTDPNFNNNNEGAFSCRDATAYNWYIVASRIYTEGGMDSFEYDFDAQGTVEYCALWGNQGTQPNHGNAIDFFYSNHGSTVRYNIIRDSYNHGYPGTTINGDYGSSPYTWCGCGTIDGQTLCYGNVVDGTGANAITEGVFQQGDYYGACPNVVGRNELCFNNTLFFRATDSGGWGIAMDFDPSTTGNKCYNNLIVSLNTASKQYSVAITGNADFQNNVTNSDTSVFVNPSARENGSGNALRLSRSIGNGTPISAPFNMDMTGNTRGQTGNWDIGAFQSGSAGPCTNPLIALSSASLMFQSMVTNTSTTLTFNVTNICGGTLTGTASTSSPFSITSGGSYSLTSNQSQTITVKYAPINPSGLDSGTVTCTGGGGATVALTGYAYDILGLSFPSTNGLLSNNVYSVSNQFIYTTTEIDNPTASAQAYYCVNIPSNGTYFITANAIAGSQANNSYYPSWNTNGSEPFTIWDLQPTNSAATNYYVSWRANGSTFLNQSNPMYWNLNSGTNTLIISAREAYTFLGQITIMAPASACTNPVIVVVPISNFRVPIYQLNFAPLLTNTTATLQVYVTNTCGGTLTGTASTSSPFSITSGASYSLGVNQSQVVTVQYAPTVVSALDTNNITFTGGGGASLPVTGSSYSIPTPVGLQSPGLFFGPD